MQPGQGEKLWQFLVTRSRVRAQLGTRHTAACTAFMWCIQRLHVHSVLCQCPPPHGETTSKQRAIRPFAAAAVMCCEPECPPLTSCSVAPDTPVCILSIQSKFASYMLAVVWGLTIAGVVQKATLQVREHLGVDSQSSLARAQFSPRWATIGACLTSVIPLPGQA
eukprot:767409-Hanusia_phi.AAC.2